MIYIVLLPLTGHGLVQVEQQEQSPLVSQLPLVGQGRLTILGQGSVGESPDTYGGPDTCSGIVMREESVRRFTTVDVVKQWFSG